MPERIQDAHEAIRPTDITRTPILVKESLARDQFRLYQLIWKRFTASRMAHAVYETTSGKDSGRRITIYHVSASQSDLRRLHVRLCGGLTQKEEENNVLLKGIGNEHEAEPERACSPAQHFTQPPAHYTEASLVKALEEQGIGRPSTYAPTITTILASRYVAKENKNLYVTELGEVVNSHHEAVLSRASWM